MSNIKNISKDTIALNLCVNKDLQTSTAQMLKSASQELGADNADIKCFLMEVASAFADHCPSEESVKFAADVYDIARSSKFASIAAPAAILAAPSIGAVVSGVGGAVQGISNITLSTIPPTMESAGKMVHYLEKDINEGSSDTERSRARTTQYKIMTERLKAILEAKKQEAEQLSK